MLLLLPMKKSTLKSKEMRNRNARTITVEDRAAANGDIVNIDFEGFVDGKAFEGGKAERFNLTLGSGQFIPGFEDQIVGHNTGDEFDVNVTFPEDYQASELAGKPAVFKCKLHEISAKELPALDDEFVKDVSEFDTLDDLKADIRSKLTTSKENAANTAFENTLIDGVIANMEGEIPEEMFDARADEMVQDFEYRLSSQGMSLDVYMQYTGSTRESLRASFKEQATRQVKVALALEKIVEAEGITATDEEVEAEVAKLVEQYKSQNITAEQIKAAMGRSAQERHCPEEGCRTDQEHRCCRVIGGYSRTFSGKIDIRIVFRYKFFMIIGQNRRRSV